MKTDTSKGGLEGLICASLTGDLCDPPEPGRSTEAAGSYGGLGWITVDRQRSVL